MALTEQLSRLCLRIADEMNERVRSHHPGLARAWVSFGVQRNHLSIRSSYNVLRVVRLHKGHFRVHFSEPMPHTHCCWHAGALSPRPTAQCQRWLTFFCPVLHRPTILVVTATLKSPHTVDVICTTYKGRYSDSPDIHLVVYA